MSVSAPTKMGLFAKKPVVATEEVIPSANSAPVALQQQEPPLVTETEVEQEIVEEAEANISNTEESDLLDEDEGPLEVIFAEVTHQEDSAEEPGAEEVAKTGKSAPFPSLDAKYLHGEIQHTFFQHKGPVNVRFVLEVAHKRMLDMDIEFNGRWVRATNGQMESMRRHIRDNLIHILATETHGIIANDEAPEWSDVPAEKPAAAKPGF